MKFLLDIPVNTDWHQHYKFNYQILKLGVFGSHNPEGYTNMAKRDIYIYLPYWPAKIFIAAHENCHVWMRYPQDHPWPKGPDDTNEYCLMNGSTASDGWKEKGLGIWWEIWLAKTQRAHDNKAIPWLCETCYYRTRNGILRKYPHLASKYPRR